MNSGTAGKYGASVAIAFLLVVLMKITGVQEFWFGMQIATLILVLAWIITLLPATAKGVKTAIMVLIAVTAILAFVLPLTVRLTVSPSVQRSWETSSIAQRLWLSRWLYDPAARAREASEEHCRDENQRLSNGGERSEIGKTLGEIEELVKKNPNMDLLMTARKTPKEMSLKEVLETQNSQKPSDKYRALQRKLQMQRDSAVAEYNRCMGEGEVENPVAATADTPKEPKSTTSAAANLKKKVDKLKADLPQMTGEQVARNAVVIGYALAGILLVLSILFAVVRLHKAVDIFFWVAFFIALATTVLWLGTGAG